MDATNKLKYKSGPGHVDNAVVVVVTVGLVVVWMTVAAFSTTIWPGLSPIGLGFCCTTWTQTTIRDMPLRQLLRNAYIVRSRFSNSKRTQLTQKARHARFRQTLVVRRGNADLATPLLTPLYKLRGWPPFQSHFEPDCQQDRT